MATKRRQTPARKKRQTSRARPAAKAIGRGPSAPRKFVGRDPSPVLDRYPPKDAGLGRPPTLPGASPATATRTVPTAAPTPGTPSPPASPGTTVPLINLDRPFDVDEFSQLLGETTIEVLVPREDLGEVLRRISDFMGFGIYVYRFSVRPEPSDQLKRFVVQLQRVDYAPESQDWVEFTEKGRSESPFGPGSTK